MADPIPNEHARAADQVRVRHFGMRRGTRSPALGQIWLVLIAVALTATACGNSSPMASAPESTAPSAPSDVTTTPVSEPTATPVPPGITTTSAPSTTIFFPQQAPVPGERSVMSAALIGELVAVDGCLRVNATYADASYLVIWPPDVKLHIENHTIQILNQAGQVVARVEEEVFLDGGEIHSLAGLEAIRQPLRQKPPDVCPGPYWLVGNEVRVNQRNPADIVTVNEISTADRTFFLFKQTPVIDEWVMGETVLAGKLVLVDHCLRVQTTDSTIEYLPLWPPSYAVSLEYDSPEIVNGSEQVVARVGDEVRLSGGAITQADAPKQYEQLRQKIPAACPGPYWLVSNIHP